jgi:Rod binding domain-containing protein
MNVASSLLGAGSFAASLSTQLGSAPGVASAVNTFEAITSFSDELQKPVSLDPKTKQAIADFESVFVSSLLKQMRQSIDGDGLFPGDKSDTLGGLFDMFMGQHLAQAGGLGVSEMLLDTYRRSAT